MSAIHELVTSFFFISFAHVANHLFVLRRFFFDFLGCTKWNLNVVPWLLQIILLHDHVVTNFSSEHVYLKYVLESGNLRCDVLALFTISLLPLD